ncbi:TIGR03086 family metal-binding protein [Dactylosporangium sp. CA-092794]|uniref:TIGR03086 family metal-binding protein n=1 Tax=Dactylosporangium sp. CA-092794 TaxID=3239929 RepID=UPI003D947AB0
MNTPLLAVRGLTVDYRKPGRGGSVSRALDGVDVEASRGRTVAIVGESGSGKSTLGNAVLGLVPPTAGSIVFDGVEVVGCDARTRRELTRHIQPVFQDPYGSLNPMRTIGQTLEEPLLVHTSMSRSERAGEVARALTMVGLSPDAAHRYPAGFSGGQRQRIAIARALIPKPRLIVCDEPTSALDLSIQAQILNLLRRVQRELDLTMLFISHDLGVVRHVADDIVVLYHGRVLEHGPAREVCDEPKHPYTRRLLAAVPDTDPDVQRRRHVSLEEDDSTVDIIDAYMRVSAQAEELVRSIPDDRFGFATPCPGWDVRALCNHIHAGDIVISSRIRGTTLPDPKSAEDRLGDDPRATLCAGFDELRGLLSKPDVLDRHTTTVGPQGDVHDAIVGNLLAKRVADMVVHNWDLAKALGLPTAGFAPDLVAWTLAHFEARTAEDRSHNHIAIAERPQPAPRDATDADRLAARLGRPVDFAPGPFDRSARPGDRPWTPWDKA